MKPVETLVVLADDRQARVLANSGVGKGLNQIAQFDAATLSGADIAYSDTPGRSHSGPGGAHHGMEPSSSEERQNRERFARDLMVALEKTWTKGRFDRLVIAAPPKMLGVLRDRLPKAMADAVLADLAKDLVNTPAIDLPGHFVDIAAF